MIRIRLLPEGKMLESKGGGSTIIEVLRGMGIKPDTVIVLREGKPVPIDDKVNKNDKITILKVVSLG